MTKMTSIPCNPHNSVVRAGDQKPCNAHDSNVISENVQPCNAHDSNVISGKTQPCNTHDSYVLEGSSTGCDVHDSYVLEQEGSEMMGGGCDMHDSVVAFEPGDEPIIATPTVRQSIPPPVQNIPLPPPLLMTNSGFVQTPAPVLPQQLQQPESMMRHPLPVQQIQPRPQFQGLAPDLGSALGVIYNYLQSAAGVNTLGRKHQDFITCTNEIRNMFDALAHDQTICASNQFILLVKGCVTYLKAVVLDYAMTDDLVMFIDTFCNLVVNWNNNVARIDELTIDAQLVGRQCHYWLNSKELLDTLKRLIDRARNLSNFALPTIVLSEHYLRSMKKPGGGATKPTTGPLLKINNVSEKEKPAETQGS